MYFVNPNLRRKPKNKQKDVLMQVLKLTPHIILGTMFVITWLQWLYMNRHISKMSLYYDLYQHSNNPNVIATYGKIREVLLTDPQFSLYINQPMEYGQNSKDLIVENPVFVPHTYKQEGTIGKVLDDKVKRYIFDCSFRDISKDSEGKIQSIVIFNDKNEAYFETLTIFINKPVEKVIRIQANDIDEDDSPFKRFNLHKQRKSQSASIDRNKYQPPPV